MSNPKPRTILLVNDSQEDRDSIRNTLASTSSIYEFIDANSKAQALEFMEIIQFDCIILDSLLTNLEILQELSNSPFRNNTPIILVSDFGITETAIEAMKLAGNNYLQKSEMTPASLQKAIKSCIERADLHAIDVAESNWLNSVLESLPEGVISINHQGIINYFNNAAERLSGWQAIDLLGHPLAKLLRPSDRAQIGGILSIDGKLIPFLDNPISIKDSFSNVTGTIYILNNKPIHNQIANSESELITLISHEIRNPLNSILGYTRLLRLQKNLSEQAMQMLEIIERNGHVQLQFITDLLDISKIINSEIKIQLRMVNPVPILQEVITLLTHAAGAKATSIITQIEEDIPLIASDSERLQQLFNKIISQAIKLTSYEGHVNIRLWRDKNWLHLQIINDGNGIDPQVQAYIFGRHILVNGKMVNQLNAIGLNLLLIRRYVELLDGVFKVESAGIRNGTTFIISLPIYNEVIHSQEVFKDNAEHNKFSGLNIFAVIKEKETQEILLTVLSEKSAVVTLVSNAKEAYDLLTSDLAHKYDLFIADVELPDEDGYSLIRKIRKIPAYSFAQLPAIALIVETQAEDRIRCLRAGYQTHVSKPLDPSDLVTVIAAILDGQDQYE